MLSCVLNHLPKSSSILSNQASFVAALLLHADRTEHALSLYYKDQEQLAYEPASYEAVKAPGSPVAGEQGHFSRLCCPTHSENRRQQKDQGLSEGCPPHSGSQLKQQMGVSPSSAKRGQPIQKAHRPVAKAMFPSALSSSTCQPCWQTEPNFFFLTLFSIFFFFCSIFFHSLFKGVQKSYTENINVLKSFRKT